MIRIFAIDDQPEFLDLLTKEVKCVSEILKIDILLSCYTDVKCINFSDSFDIFFLDIEMPEKSGFEISAEFTEKQVKIVYVTAIENYVFKSFENHAYDFIRKSNLHDDLIRVLSRYIHEYSPIFSIPYHGSIIQINSKDIIFIRMMRNDLCLFLPGKQLTIRKTLKLFLSDYALDKSNLFIQINRSELVNINKIHSINKNRITLYDGSNLYITKKYMEEFIRKYYTISKRE